MQIEDLIGDNRLTKAERAMILIQNRNILDESFLRSVRIRDLSDDERSMAWNRTQANLAKYEKPADEDVTGPTLIMMMLDALRTRHEP